jgi:hypothetical protein
MSTETNTNTAYSITDLGTVTLGKTTYSVREMVYTNGNFESEVTLTGPRGAEYFLRPIMSLKDGRYANHDGLFNAVSYKGSCLKDHGVDMKIIRVGDLMERFDLFAASQAKREARH